MVQRCRSPWELGLMAVSLGLGVVTAGEDAIAQVVPDASLGAESSTVDQLNFLGIPLSLISGGAQRGSNLFHSFAQFSIPTGQAAFFNHATNIQTIISRVTGSSVSTIDGLIVSNGTVNLFLINPNGIIIGPNAALGIGGSFLASTANRLIFPNGTEFSTTNPQAPPLLTINVPIGLGFTGVPGNIRMQSALFTEQTDSFTDFALIGGNVALEGTTLQTPGYHVELGGLADTGIVGMTVNANNLRFQFPDGVPRAGVSIGDRSRISVRAGDSGSLAIHAGSLNLSESVLLAGIEAGSGTIASQAGNIDLNATGAIAIADSFIVNLVGAGSIGNSGNITITSGSLTMTNSTLSTQASGQGDAGNITIQATDAVSLDQRSVALSAVGSEVVGNGGDITITARSLSVTNGSLLGTNTFGQGNAGNLTIQATDAILFDGGNNFLSGITGASTLVSEGGVGDGGRITITARSLSVLNFAQLVASSAGQGNAGGITIQVDDTIHFDSFSGAQSIVLPGAAGNAGDIEITAKTLWVSNAAYIGTNTIGQGNAADIIIRASDRVHFDRYGNALSGVSSFGGTGEGGDIQVFTGSLSITNGARLSASTSGQGNAGNILINTRDAVLLEGSGVPTGLFPGGEPSGLFTDADSRSSGRGGDITVNTGSFRVANGAVVNTQTFNFNNGGDVTINANQLEALSGGQITTTTRSSGQAGSITLNILDRILLSGRDPTYGDRLARLGANIENEGAASGLYANTAPGSTGNGGNIFIDPRSVIIQDGARVTVDSQGIGQGGNIQLQAGRLTLNNQGIISAETAGNQGGNIILQIESLFLLRRGSQISTTAGTAQAGGNGGNIIINAPFILAVPSENSDITANAFTGQGGSVDITAEGIFGLQFRPRLTPLSDITASSEFGVSGTVTLNTPNVDPSQGLAPLPINLVDPTTQITQSCQPGETQPTSSFVATGRGGVPPSPTDVLQGETVVADWITVDGAGRGAEKRSQSPVPVSQSDGAIASTTQHSLILEAQGWVRRANGEIWLVARELDNAPSVTGLMPVSCFKRMF